MSPEQHGTITGVFKNQIDWIPLSLGSVRPTQGRVVAIAQVRLLSLTVMTKGAPLNMPCDAGVLCASSMHACAGQWGLAVLQCCERDAQFGEHHRRHHTAASPC